jgi:hypothetical protein
MDVQVPVEAARDSDRPPTRVEDLLRSGEAHRDRQERGLELFWRAATAGRVHEEVEHGDFTGCGGREQEPAAAEARQGRLGHRRRKAGRDHSVEGVATRLQNGGGGSHCVRVTGRNTGLTHHGDDNRSTGGGVDQQALQKRQKRPKVGSLTAGIDLAGRACVGPAGAASG